MFDKTAYGLRLKAYRESKDISRDEFAEVLGVSKAHITQIENGNNAPSMDLFIDSINKLHLAPDYLIQDSIDEPCPTVLDGIAEKVKRLSGKNAIALNEALEALIKYLDI